MNELKEATEREKEQLSRDFENLQSHFEAYTQGLMGVL
jgi:hypothetical protein